jgi:RNA polymerase sigma-70 factor (ECF subfamily)
MLVTRADATTRTRRPCYVLAVPLPLQAPPGAPGAPATDDAALVALVAQANRAALGILYDRHAPSLLAVGIRMLRSQREAQDLLHDVFLEVWEHAREYDAAKATVRTWLFVRLRSRALDRLGRAEHKRTRSLSDSDATLDLREAATVEAVDSIAVKQALAQLPPDVREALDLTYFDGLTAREIAERTSVPIGTVKSRLSRGLVALGTLLRAEKEQSDES